MEDSKEQKTDILQQQALLDLVDSFGKGDVERAEASLRVLGARVHGELYQRVGEMTRSLHQSLGEFRKNLSANSITMHSTNIPDATSKLEEVIALTRDASHKTLENSEKISELVDESSKARTELKQWIDNRVSDDDTKKYLADYLEEQEQREDRFKKLNTEIIMTQEFQDLTGQALRKVIKLVSELELNLVGLVRTFGLGEQSEAAPSAIQNEGEAEKRSDLAQDDVDDLLNSLGF